MSKKPHPLEAVENIFGTLQANTAPPSPAPVEKPKKRETTPQSPPEKGPKGRPKTGKKSDDEYCQTTISIRKDTRKRVKQALLDAESGQDVSDLVEELLGKWLESL